MRSIDHPVVIATGSAGTGKTMLACAEAVDAVRCGRVDRIVITRPTATMESDLGFLPGALQEKMHPWMLPVMEYLAESSSDVETRRWVRDGVVEVAPLNFMRGRTFKRTFIIGDECQNIRVPSMRMLLTRIGDDSKMVITGDPDQTDLPHHETSGLSDIVARCTHMHPPGIGLVHLGEECIARHPVIPIIMRLYES